MIHTNLYYIYIHTTITGCCIIIIAQCYIKEYETITCSIEPTHTRNTATQVASYDLLDECECVYYKRWEDKLPWDSQDPLLV